MKKNFKKIKLEDLKIQSFSTSSTLSKDETNKIIGGATEPWQGCGGNTATNGCFCDTQGCSGDCSESPYGCNGTGGQPTVASDCCATWNCSGMCTGPYC